jgi:hypothetical protein
LQNERAVQINSAEFEEALQDWDQQFPKKIKGNMSPVFKSDVSGDDFHGGPEMGIPSDINEQMSAESSKSVLSLYGRSLQFSGRCFIDGVSVLVSECIQRIGWGLHIGISREMPGRCRS